MPLSVYELETSTRRTSNLRETDLTPRLQQALAQVGKAQLMQLSIGWDYMANNQRKIYVRNVLAELLLEIMRLTRGREYSAIYVKKVHGARDAGQAPPSATDAWGRVRGPMFQNYARMAQANTDAMDIGQLGGKPYLAHFDGEDEDGDEGEK